MLKRNLSNVIKIEQHGVHPVPPAERTKNWWDLFVIQAGVNIALSTFLVGGLLVPALSWSDAIWALVIGNGILGISVALMGYMGVDYGIPASVASRFSLGYPRGTILSSLCILLSLTGWFAVNAEIGGVAVDQVLESTFGYSSPTLMIILVGISNAIIAVVGFESIKWLSRLSVPLLLGLSGWLFWAIGQKYDILDLIQFDPTGEVHFTTAIDWTVGGLVVGIFVASDVSRYVRSRKDNWMGSLFGIVPATSVLMVLGALTKLATGDWNPVNAIETLGLGLPALFIIFFSTWTTNDLNIYGGGLALSNIIPRLTRWQNTLIVSVIGTTLAALRITEHFTSFLEMLAYVFSPLIGVVMCDFFLIRHMRLNMKEVYQKDGIYSYSNGVNYVAITVVGIGMLIGYLIPPFLVASVISILFSGLLYFLLMKWFYRVNVRHDV